MDPLEVFLEKWILRGGKAILWTVAVLVCAPIVPPFIAYRYVRDRRCGRRPQPWLAFMTRPGRVTFLVLALVGSEGVALAMFGAAYLGMDEHVPSVAAGPVIASLALTLAVDAAARSFLAAARFAAARL